MERHEAQDYRGIGIEPCDDPMSGQWHLVLRDAAKGECVECCGDLRFDTLGRPAHTSTRCARWASGRVC